MKLRFGWIAAKTTLVLVLLGAISVFEKLAHPVLSASAAIGQLADTVDSSAQMTAYGWIIPVAWLVVTFVFVLSVYTEVRATLALNQSKEEER